MSKEDEEFSEKLAKEIAEITDESFDETIKKYFVRDYCDCSGNEHANSCPLSGNVRLGIVYNPLKIDNGLEPPKPNSPKELYRMCWDIINELKDANKVYFVDEIPEEMSKVYDIADMIENWLLKNSHH